VLYRSSIGTHEDEDVKILSSAESQGERLLDQIIAGNEKAQANSKDKDDVRRSVQEPRPSPGEKHFLCLGTCWRRCWFGGEAETQIIAALASADPSTPESFDKKNCGRIHPKNRLITASSFVHVYEQLTSTGKSLV